MRNLTLYVQREYIIYSYNSKRGVVDKKSVESLIKEMKGGVLNVIVSKPDILFRRLEFPFKSQRKIKLVLPHELEDILPEPASNFSFSFEFHRNANGKTVVNMIAVKNEILDYWREVAEKNKVKLFFFSDMTILSSLLRRYTSTEDNMGMFVAQDYTLVNITEKSRLTGSYSYNFSLDESDKVQEMLKTILSSKKIPLFFIGSEEMKNRFKNILTDATEIKLATDAKGVQIIPSLVNSGIFKQSPLNLRKITVKNRVPIHLVLFFLTLLVASFIAFTPYFRLSEVEAHREQIINEMKERFHQACPEVTRIVDPLVQIKEKIMEKTTKLNVVSNYPPILKVMADVTTLFPDNLNVEIEHFSVAANALNLFGRVDSLKSLEKVKSNAIDSEKFTNVVIGAISFDDKNRVTFNMTLGIKEYE
jgi:hypothetical protein